MRDASAGLSALLASYGSYHRDPRNQRTHFVGVPLIVYALLGALAWAHLSVFGVRLSLDRVALLALAVFYLYLDGPLGIALTALLALLAGAAEATARWGPAVAGPIIGAAFIGGWCLQLLGHRLEGNRPALLDNAQQIFIAPIYLTAELGFILGLRRSLQAQIEQRIAATAARFAS